MDGSWHALEGNYDTDNFFKIKNYVVSVCQR
jgi:hypothetical protein